MAEIEVDSALDLIRTTVPDDQPTWTENIAFWMHDPAASVRLYAHLGRMQPDRSIWEGLSIIFLPSGDLLVNRSLGVSRGAAENHEYRYRPLVPNRIWTFEFTGIVQRVRPETPKCRPVIDEPVEVASYDLVFEAVQPVFNMHGSDLKSERMHLEQGGSVRGSFVIGHRRTNIDCYGYRDHSVSQRTFTTLDSETWANCVFANGNVFSMLQVRRGDKQILEGQIYRSGRMHHARPVVVPDLRDIDGAPGAFAISLEIESAVIDIDGEIVQPSFPFNLLRPTGMRPGIDDSRLDSLVAVQCPTKYRWGTEVGYGWLERTRRLEALRSR